MKVEVSEVKNEIEFPCLMKLKSTGNIILATGFSESGSLIGTKLSDSGGICSQGEHFSGWNSEFEPIPKGTTITLQND
jgi:hypothetical protein